MPRKTENQRLPHPRPQHLNGHALNDQVLGILRWRLTIGAAQDRPTTLERSHPEHAGSVQKGRHHVALPWLNAMLGDHYVAGEERHWSQGGIGYTHGKDAGASADGNGRMGRGWPVAHRWRPRADARFEPMVLAHDEVQTRNRRLFGHRVDGAADRTRTGVASTPRGRCGPQSVVRIPAFFTRTSLRSSARWMKRAICG